MFIVFRDILYKRNHNESKADQHITKNGGNDMSEINRLKLVRKMNNLKQSDVADILGCATSTYTQYELGTNKIPVDALIVLSGYYKMSIDYLVGNPHKIDNAKIDRLKKEIIELIQRIENE